MRHGKTIAIATLTLLVGLLLGAVGGIRIYQHAFGNAGDFATGRAQQTARLLVTPSGQMASDAQVRSQVIAQVRAQWVQASLLAQTSLIVPTRDRLEHQVDRMPAALREEIFAGGADSGTALPSTPYTRPVLAATQQCLQQSTSDKQLSQCTIAAVQATSSRG